MRPQSRDEWVLYALAAVVIVTGALYFGVVRQAWGAERVGICHRTQSETHPWVYLEVDAHGPNGHFGEDGPLPGHERDFLVDAEHPCPPEEAGEDPTVTATLTSTATVTPLSEDDTPTPTGTTVNTPTGTPSPTPSPVGEEVPGTFTPSASPRPVKHPVVAPTVPATAIQGPQNCQEDQVWAWQGQEGQDFPESTDWRCVPLDDLTSEATSTTVTPLPRALPVSGTGGYLR